MAKALPLNSNTLGLHQLPLYGIVTSFGKRDLNETRISRGSRLESEDSKEDHMLVLGRYAPTDIRVWCLDARGLSTRVKGGLRNS